MFDRIKNFFSGTADAMQVFVSTAWTGLVNRSQYQLLREYKNIVYACINAIAEDVGKYEPIFSSTKPKNGKNVTPIKHPLEQLLENPGNGLSKYELFLATEVYLQLTGEAYWYLPRGEQTKQVKEIVMLRPDRVSHYYNQVYGDLIGYHYLTDAGTRVPFELDEIQFFKRFNPLNPNRGLGTVQAGLLYIDTETATSTFQNSFMRNQATPSGVLSVGSNLSKEAFKKLKIEWKEQQAGLHNAGKTLFIRGAEAKFEKMGLSIGDVEMPMLKKITKEDVREMFRVPAQLLGTTESIGAGGLGRANMEAIEYMFAKRTVEPKLTGYDDVMQMMAIRFWPDQSQNFMTKKTTVYVTHVSQIPEDREFELRKLDKGVDRWIKRNEARQDQGYEGDAPGGDDLYQNAAEVKLGEKVEEKAATVKIAKKFVLKKEETEEEKEAKFYNYLKRLEADTESEYESTLKKSLIKQEKRVIDMFINTYKGLKKDLKSDLLTVMTFNEEDLTLDLFALLIVSLQNAAKRGISFVGKPDIEFILDQTTRNAVFGSTERLMISFTEETALLLEKQLAAGLAANESVAELTKRIESVYAEAKGYKAERIARTESHKAVNQGVAEGFRQSGIKEMSWVSFPPSCKFCDKLNGSIVKIGAPFLVKGDKVVADDGSEYINDYSSVDYADLHPNCDCRLKPI